MFRSVFPLLAGLALLAALAFPSLALAHRVNLFAYVDNGKVMADCFYSKSRKVNHGQVIVTDAVTGAELLRGETDENGAFSFPVPEAARTAGHGLKLTLIAGEGHQNEAEVSAQELGVVPAAAPAAAAPASTWVAPAPEPAPAAAPADNAALARLVEEAVARQLSPLKRMLAETQEAGPGAVEIVGGIGYIFGLFGVAAFMASRKKR